LGRPGCINQDDMIDKQHQVRLMGKLYSDAGNVIIWLGEGTDATDELARILNVTDFLSRHEPGVKGPLDVRETYTAQIFRVYILTRIVSIRPWWGRVWLEKSCDFQREQGLILCTLRTVQECVLSQNVPIIQCGTKTISWQKFFDVHKIVSKPDIKHPSPRYRP
jgi:hypothetical protein